MVEAIKDKQKIEKIKNFLKKQSKRDYLLFTLGINTGLRISDLLRLKVGDVYNKTEIVITEQKTGKKRVVTLNKVAIDAINDFLKDQDINPSHYLFRSRKGKNKPISRIQAWEILSKAGELVGVNIGTHTLRKTFGYHAYKQGIDITLLQQLFGHSSPAVTLRYIGITADDIRNVYQNLNL